MVNSTKSLLRRLLFINGVLWVLLTWLFFINMDQDMYENYAWGQTLEWGSFKHPPLFAWITRWWFTLWPITNIAYFMLSYCNAAIGLWGVISLAKLFHQTTWGEKANQEHRQKFLFLVLIFSVLSLPYGIYAAIFNADSILLSLWPWIAYAFFACLHASQPKKKWGWAILLGILAAVGMLGKYFSAVLLLSLFCISLLEKRYRAWYVSPYPYVSLLFFLAFLAPHAFWEYRMNFPFRSYYSEYFTPELSMARLLKTFLIFAASGIYFFFMAVFVWWPLSRFPRQQGIEANTSALRPLYALCILPCLLSLVFFAFAGVYPKVRWAIPIWFALPLLMAHLLSYRRMSIKTPIKLLKRCWLIIAVFFIILTVSSAWLLNYPVNHFDIAEGHKEMAAMVARHFQQTFPGKTLSWVGGSIWPNHPAALAFYLPEHPRALPGFPDQNPALVNPHATWQQEYGALVCGVRDKEEDAKLVEECEARTRYWLHSKQLPLREIVLHYHAENWRFAFAKTPEKKLTVFWVPPR